MLCITRKEGEEIVIECDEKLLRLVVSAVKGNKVSLRFQGHEDMVVLRKEIHDRIQGELQR